MPPEKEGEARSPASVSMPLDTVGEDEQGPEPETARGRGSASSRPANLKRTFEESFQALPAKGTISQRYGKRGGGDLMPPWKAGEDVLMAHRVRARHVFERARSSTPAVPDNVPKKEKRYWQRLKGPRSSIANQRL